MPKRKTETPLLSTTLAPVRCLGPCPGCGCTVIEDTWEQHGTTGVPIGTRLTPVRGDVHDCAVAVIQHAAHWQYTLRLVEPRRFP